MTTFKKVNRLIIETLCKFQLKKCNRITIKNLSKKTTKYKN